MFEGGGALGPIMDMAKSMFNMPIDSQMINEKLGLNFTTIIRIFIVDLSPVALLVINRVFGAKTFSLKEHFKVGFRIPTVKLKIPGKSIFEIRIPNFCYIQVQWLGLPS